MLSVGGSTLKRLTEKSLPPFNYALIDKSDAKIGAFNDYDAFYAHQMAVKRLGELEDLFERLQDIKLIDGEKLLETLKKRLPTVEDSIEGNIDVNYWQAIIDARLDVHK